MVQFVEKQSSSTVTPVASAPRNQNRVGSHFDDLLTSPGDLSKQRLANELATELWSRLPISRVASESGHRGIEYIIRIATASTTQVSTWYRELIGFVPAIAQAATEYRGDELTDALRTELSADIERQMLEQIRYPLPSRSFVDFKFADLPPAEAWTQANRHLEQACLQFANQVFELFDTLQQKKIVGRIQETSSTCRFTFFRRVAILANIRKRTEKRTRRDPDFQIPGHAVFLEETFQISDFEVQHRHAQCVHHVRNPVLNDPNATDYPLPPKYRSLIDCCPDWMAGSLRVLEGELFREERIEWDLNSETRTDEKVIERVRRCPAVVFGPYILAGWGELAIADEENRQRDKQIHATKTASAKQHRTLAFVLAAVAITVMSFSVWATPIVASLAILIGLSAMFTSASAAHFALSARGLLSTGRVMLHGGLMGSIVFAIQSLVYSVLHRSLAAFGMAALFALIASIAFAVKAKQKELENFRVD